MIQQQYQQWVMPTYVKTGLTIVRGKGVTVWDDEGQPYLDFFPGWGVCGLGHCHPRLVKAIHRQARQLMHVANNYDHPWQAQLAERLVAHAFDGKVFFANSGAEMVESAIKLARRWGQPDRHEIITMTHSFHGRTTGALSATGQTKYQEGFTPLLPGFAHVPFGDFKALEQALTPRTIAVLAEPIQGEGGIRVATREYWQQARELCTRRKLLLILDEVQTGMGRTGRWFAYQHYDIQPDVLLLAKMLGGGFPIGAMIAARPIADTLSPGTHASTFGGSPLACAAALAVVDALEQDDLVAHAARQGEYLASRLRRLKTMYHIIKEVRGLGLMQGVELTVDGRAVVDRCRETGLLINCTQHRALRLLPPLTVTKAAIDRAVRILDDALRTAHDMLEQVTQVAKWPSGGVAE